MDAYLNFPDFDKARIKANALMLICCIYNNVCFVILVILICTVKLTMIRYLYKASVDYYSRYMLINTY